jgi:excisionase family DNA binding protein
MKTKVKGRMKMTKKEGEDVPSIQGMPAARSCGRCGQTIHPEKDSWNLKNGRMQHVTCPASPETQALPTIREAGALYAAPDAPVFLTLDQAAALLQCHKNTIRNQIDAGRLPAKRLRGGRSVLVDRRDVLALLEDIPAKTIG